MLSLVIRRIEQVVTSGGLPINPLVQEFVSFAKLPLKGHKQWYPPTMFWQVADSEQGLGLCSHSLTSTVGKKI